MTPAARKLFTNVCIAALLSMLFSTVALVQVIRQNARLDDEGKLIRALITNRPVTQLKPQVYVTLKPGLPGWDEVTKNDRH